MCLSFIIRTQGELAFMYSDLFLRFDRIILQASYTFIIEFLHHVFKLSGGVKRYGALTNILVEINKIRLEYNSFLFCFICLINFYIIILLHIVPILN